MMKWLGIILFFGIILLGVLLWTPVRAEEPRPLTGVEDTCDDQFDECVKMCKETPRDENPLEGCILECEEEADWCYRLP